MLIHRLQIDGFRNYRREDLRFDENFNLICGANAQGKSNLLEAICYLGIASSFRMAGESDLINSEQSYFYLEGEMTGKDGPFAISAAANRAKKRKWKIDGEPCTRLADVIGLFHIVIFAPEDIWLTRSGPEWRRRYLNRQLAQNDRAYCRDQLRYSRILRQRNALLKQGEAVDAAALAVWDDQLVETGARLTLARYTAVQRLLPLARELHAQLTGGEVLGIRYLSPVLRGGEPAALPQVEEQFRAELQRTRRAELIQGMTLIGPHRDDLALSIDGQAARDFASQGQQRTLALSLKLAELELAREYCGEYPVLLLDDVLSELDEQRRRALLNLTADKTQTFLTAVAAELPERGGATWLVEKGTVRQPAGHKK